MWAKACLLSFELHFETFALVLQSLHFLFRSPVCYPLELAFSKSMTMNFLLRYFLLLHLTLPLGPSMFLPNTKPRFVQGNTLDQVSNHGQLALGWCGKEGEAYGSGERRANEAGTSHTTSHNDKEELMVLTIPLILGSEVPDKPVVCLRPRKRASSSSSHFQLLITSQLINSLESCAPSFMFLGSFSPFLCVFLLWVSNVLKSCKQKKKKYHLGQDIHALC